MNRHYNFPTKNLSFYSCCPLQPKIINSVDRLGECRSSVQYWILGYKRWLLRWPAILLPGWGCIIGFKGGFLSYQALSSHFKFLEAHSPIYSINFPLLRTWIKLPLPEPYQKQELVHLWPESINKELQGIYERASSYFISKISPEQLHDY